jgi:hypothetical protein
VAASAHHPPRQGSLAGAGLDWARFLGQQAESQVVWRRAEIPTDEGKLFLDSVLDMGSRRVVGFALDEHHDAKLAHAALSMAVAVRGGKQAITAVIMHHRSGQ